MVLRLYNGIHLNNKENHLRIEPHTHFLWIIATQPDTATIIHSLFVFSCFFLHNKYSNLGFYNHTFACKQMLGYYKGLFIIKKDQ